MKRAIRLLLSCVPVLLNAVAGACPMCKDSIPASDAPAQAGLPGGFNLSIYSMLGGLLVVLCFLAAFLAKAIRQADRRANSD